MTKLGYSWSRWFSKAVLIKKSLYLHYSVLFENSTDLAENWMIDENFFQGQSENFQQLYWLLRTHGCCNLHLVHLLSSGWSPPSCTKLSNIDVWKTITTLEPKKNYLLLLNNNIVRRKDESNKTSLKITCLTVNIQSY